MLGTQTVVAFLKTVRNDDSWELLDKTFDILDAYQIDDYMTAFENVFADQDQLGDEDRVAMILTQARSAMIEVLRVQGIMVTEHIPLRTLNTLAQAVYDITWYEDKSRVLDICNGHDTAVEKVCEILCLTCAMQVEQVLPLLVGVTPNVIAILRSQVEGHVDVHEPDEEYLKSMQKYHVWKNTEGFGLHVGLFADRFTASVGSMNMPFSIYYQAYSNSHSLSVDPTGEQLVELARELIALAIISSDASKNALVFIKAVIPKIYPDIKTATALESIVSKMLLEFNKVFTNHTFA